MTARIMSLYLALLISLPTLAIAQPTEMCRIGDIDYDNLPLILPEPGYVSELDVVNNRGSATMDAKGMFDTLSGAAQDFAFIKQTLAEWNSNLANTEEAFWNKFDEQGKVTGKERKEYGYWLHKRELWTYTKSEFSNAVGGGLSNLLFSGFGFSEEMSTRAPVVSGPPEGYINNPEYIEYFRSLSRYGFLENSACSPKNDSSLKGKLFYKLMYPDRSASQASVKLEQLDEYLSTNNKTYEEALAYVKKAKLTDSVNGAASYIDKFMQETTLEDVYLARVKFRVGVNKVSSPKSGNQSLYYIKDDTSTFEGFSVTYPGMAGRSINYVAGKVDLEPFIGKNLWACLEPNSVDLSRKLLAKHGERYAIFAAGVSMEKSALHRALDVATIISCANTGGVDNDDVNKITAGFGFPLN